MIKILIVTNLVFKDSYLKGQSNATFGGWLTSLVYALNDNGLKVGFVFRSGENRFCGSLNGIDFYSLDYSLKDFGFNQIFNHFTPDILHCEGTEYKHNLYLLENFDLPIILSLQGIIYGLDKYFMGFLLQSGLVSFLKPLTWLPYCAIYLNYLLRFKKRIQPELQILSKAKLITGRTDWDKAYAAYLSPQAKYFSIKRIIRKEFYDKKWKCDLESHTIYVGNCSRPLKGFHTVLESILILRNEFKDLKVYVSGPNPFEDRGIRGYFDYMFLIKQFIIKYKLEDTIIFTGELNANEVALTMTKVSCVVVSSFIENSPNTVAEAMFLGVPTISSYAGGVGSMIHNGYDGLIYRAGDEIMLTNAIREVLSDKVYANKLSENAYIRVRKEHNKELIVEQYIQLYNSLKC